MKLKENISIRKIGDEYMMINESGSTLDYTRVIGLNKTAAYLLQESINKSFTQESWVKLLIDKYSVEKEIAEKDVQALINKLNKEELLDE